jgi:thiol-disulfide isomerase/thioredoxin
MPPLRRLLPLIAMAVVAAGAVALYRTGPLAGAGECRAAREASARIAPLAKGELAALGVLAEPKPAPAIAFNGPDGAPIELSALNGKVRLVNLWATWCIPCRQEMPALDRLQAELGGADFEVVAVNVDTRNLERPKAWLQENGVTRLAYYADPSAKAMQLLQRSGELVGLPTTLLVDAQGCEIGVLKGPAEWASAEAKALIAAALGRPRGS